MLTDKSIYLSAGVHIGMKSCTKNMRNFVYKTREDGLSVFNLQEVDSRIGMAAEFLSKYKKILVAAHKQTSQKAALELAKAIKGKSILGRFSPGTLTNPSYKDFYEPDILLIADPMADTQSIKEAKKKRIPIIALCDTFNSTEDIDFIIPINNNGKNSVALVMWLLAREIQKNRGDGEKFKRELEDFGYEKVKKV